MNGKRAAGGEKKKRRTLLSRNDEREKRVREARFSFSGFNPNRSLDRYDAILEFSTKTHRDVGL